MKKLLITSMLMAVFAFAAKAEDLKVTSPDGRLIVTLNDNNGMPTYAVTYDGMEAVKPSRLGLITNVGDFSRGLSFKTSTTRQVSDSYSIRNIKARNVEYRANELNATYADKQNREMTVTFRVSDNNIAFRYSMPQWGKTASILIKEEATSFAFPDGTTSFICPQSSPMVGWMRTKPSYEEEYKPDAPLTDKSTYGEGYTFPCLFKVQPPQAPRGGMSNAAWVLISETGVDGKYVGSHLSDYIMRSPSSPSGESEGGLRGAWLLSHRLPNAWRSQRAWHYRRGSRIARSHSLAHYHCGQRPPSYCRDYYLYRCRRTEIRRFHRLSPRTIHMELAYMAGLIHQLSRSGEVHRPRLGYGL